jgi:hypothetical protein
MCVCVCECIVLESVASVCIAAYVCALQSSKASKACQQLVKQVSRTVTVFAPQHVRAVLQSSNVSNAAYVKLLYNTHAYAAMQSQ